MPTILNMRNASQICILIGNILPALPTYLLEMTLFVLSKFHKENIHSKHKIPSQNNASVGDISDLIDILF